MNSAERVGSNLVSEIEVYGQEGVVLGFMRNVSRSGAMLEVFEGDYIPQRGDIIHMANELQEADAEVVWSRQDGFGVCFLNRSDISSRLMMRTSFAMA